MQAMSDDAEETDVSQADHVPPEVSPEAHQALLSKYDELRQETEKLSDDAGCVAASPQDESDGESDDGGAAANRTPRKRGRGDEGDAAFGDVCVPPYTPRTFDHSATYNKKVRRGLIHWSCLLVHIC